MNWPTRESPGWKKSSRTMKLSCIFTFPSSYRISSISWRTPRADPEEASEDDGDDIVVCEEVIEKREETPEVGVDHPKNEANFKENRVKGDNKLTRKKKRSFVRGYFRKWKGEKFFGSPKLMPWQFVIFSFIGSFVSMSILGLIHQYWYLLSLC